MNSIKEEFPQQDQLETKKLTPETAEQGLETAEDTKLQTEKPEYRRSREELTAKIEVLKHNLMQLESELNGENGGDLIIQFETTGSSLSEIWKVAKEKIEIALKVLAEVGKFALAAGTSGGAMYAVELLSGPEGSPGVKELCVKLAAALGAVLWLNYRLIKNKENRAQWEAQKDKPAYKQT
jgi:hypothetical protein